MCILELTPFRGLMKPDAAHGISSTRTLSTTPSFIITPILHACSSHTEPLPLCQSPVIPRTRGGRCCRAHYIWMFSLLHTPHHLPVSYKAGLLWGTIAFTEASLHPQPGEASVRTTEPQKPQLFPSFTLPPFHGLELLWINLLWPFRYWYMCEHKVPSLFSIS